MADDWAAGIGQNDAGHARPAMLPAMALLRNVQPMRLLRRPVPFNHPDWIFEIKHDGFRALAYIESGDCRLVSRNGNTFSTFPARCDWIGKRLRVQNAVLD